MRPLIGLALVIVLTVLATLADVARTKLWDSYINYTSPYLAPLPQDAPEPALTPRVVMVLVRGLRADVSRSLPTLNKLRENGADITLELDPPLLRLPLLMTLFSGANVETHGISANQGLRDQVGADTIFLELHTREKFSSIVGSEVWDTLFGSTVSLEYADNDEQAVQAGINILNDPAIKPNFIGIELTLNEPSTSAGTNAQRLSLDANLARLMSAIDLNKNTLIVVADRGVVSDSVGSGLRFGLSETEELAAARVPLVMAGAGIRSVRAAVKANAVAPTLAILLGVPIPMHAQSIPILPALQLSGRSLIETADHSAAQLTTFYENWAAVIRQPRFAAEFYQSQRPQLRASTDARPLQNFETALNTRHQTALDAQLRSDKLLRLPLLGGTMLCIIGFLGLLISQRIWLPFLGAVLYAGVWAALFFYGRQARFSFSMFLDANPFPFLASVGRDNISIVLLVGLIMTLLAGRNAPQALYAVTDVLSTLALIVFTQALGVMWFVWQWDYTFTQFLPDSRIFTLALVALTQIASLSQPIIGFNVPIPLALCIFSLLMYALVGKKL